MPNLNIRRLDPETHTKLRVRAARNGRSMEEEARQILRAAVEEPPTDERIWDWLRRRAIERSGGIPSDLYSADLIREDRDR